MARRSSTQARAFTSRLQKGNPASAPGRSVLSQGRDRRSDRHLREPRRRLHDGPRGCSGRRQLHRSRRQSAQPRHLRSAKVFVSPGSRRVEAPHFAIAQIARAILRTHLKTQRIGPRVATFGESHTRSQRIVQSLNVAVSPSLLSRRSPCSHAMRSRGCRISRRRPRQATGRVPAAPMAEPLRAATA